MAYRIAIVGATGAVGQKFIECLEKRNFPVKELVLFASPKSLGKVLHFKSTPLRINSLSDGAVSGFDFALFSAGSQISKIYAPKFSANGTIVIDNSSAFRMQDDIPLVVPEVNPHEISRHKGIIANPNCSTIQLVVALKPIHDHFRIKRVVVSTYQAVSGAGGRAMSEFDQEVKSIVFDDRIFKREIFPKQIAFNLIPQIPQKEAFLETGYTIEETKIMQETLKIMGDKSIRITATCVRVPVKNCHSESVNIETHKPIEPASVENVLSKAPGIVVTYDYPTPLEVSGKAEVYVGRVRKDDSVENGINLWIVADNLLKGAALNAVQIAEHIIRCR